MHTHALIIIHHLIGAHIHIIILHLISIKKHKITLHLICTHTHTVLITEQVHRFKLLVSSTKIERYA